MRLSLRASLGLSYLAVILIGMGIAAPLAWLAVEQMYLDSQQANLLAQAQVAAAALGTQAPASVEPLPYSQLSNTLPGIHTRVINAQGAVVIDLAAPAGLAENSDFTLPLLAQNPTGPVSPAELLSRPEISQALQGRAATAIRRVPAGGNQRVLYAAAPVLSGDQTVTGIVYLAMPLPVTQWAALPGIVRWQIAGGLLAAALIASLAGLLLSTRISRPLNRLAAAAQAVAAGDLEQRVPADPLIRELGALGKAFNTMTDHLRQADQAKNAFIADVSHELRTPLTVIKGTIETLQDGALDDLNARGPFLEAMNAETERLIRLVNDLLVLARADAGALNLQVRPLALAALARERCAHLEQSAGKSGVQLQVLTKPQFLGDDGPWVMADPDRLAQVLDNLLNNAIRYSPPGAPVRVTIERQAGQAACRVEDSGPGIPARHLPLIFERFYRADPARGRDQGGSGLGLAIVRGLVAAQGGGVSASSIEGSGTTITFWLPAAPVDHQTDTQPPSS